MNYPPQIQKAIEELSRLPAVGKRTAEKYAFALLQLSQKELEDFARTMSNLSSTKTCSRCHHFSAESSLCPICADQKREQNIICVVADSRDLNVIENSKEYRGSFHVLGGTLNPIEGITPDKLNIFSLLERIKKEKPKEIILAFNPDMEGEATMLYLNKVIPKEIKKTRLARGLPMGADLEYADEVTLSAAISGRKSL